MVVCTYNLSSWKAEARGTAVLGQTSQSQSKFEANLDYIETLSEKQKGKN